MRTGGGDDWLPVAQSPVGSHARGRTAHPPPRERTDPAAPAGGSARGLRGQNPFSVASLAPWRFAPGGAMGDPRPGRRAPSPESMELRPHADSATHLSSFTWGMATFHVELVVTGTEWAYRRYFHGNWKMPTFSIPQL